MQKVLKASVVSQGIIAGVYLERHELSGMLPVSFLQPGLGIVFIVDSGICPRNRYGVHLLTAVQFKQLIDRLLCLLRFPKS